MPHRKIYTVTVLKESKEPGINYSGIRTWGWFSDFATAEKAVINNSTDIFEDNSYNIAVIEEVGEGIIDICLTRWWYGADYGEDYHPTVSKIDEPEWSKGLINFSMG